MPPSSSNDAHANGHVRTEEMIDLHRLTGVGCEESGESPVGQQPADVSDPLAFFARLSIAGAAADRGDPLVLVRAKEPLQPFGLRIRVIVDEGHDILRDIGAADRPRRSRRPDSALVASIFDCGKLATTSRVRESGEASTTMIRTGATVWSARCSRHARTWSGRRYVAITTLALGSGIIIDRPTRSGLR